MIERTKYDDAYIYWAGTALLVVLAKVNTSSMEYDSAMKATWRHRRGSEHVCETAPEQAKQSVAAFRSQSLSTACRRHLDQGILFDSSLPLRTTRGL